MKCNDEYEIGEKVLLSEETSWHTSGVMNPLGVVGTIVTKTYDRVYVNWGNTEEFINCGYKRFYCDFKPLDEEE